MKNKEIAKKGKSFTDAVLDVFKIQTSFHLVVNNSDCIDEIKK